MLATPRPIRWAGALLSLISLAAIVRSAVFTWRHFTSPAWGDYWLWVSDYQRWVEGRFRFHDLIKPHNDTHRIATTRVILLLDSIFFDMNGWLAVTASFVLLLAVGWMVGRLAARDGVPLLVPPLVWVALACATCQWDNLVFPFQVQFPLTCALGCGCAWLLTAASGAARGPAVAMAVMAGILAILADFSMASGILLSPALLVLLAMRRARWEAWAAFTPLCALGVALYRHHLPPLKGLPLLDWQLNWLRVRYSGNFLASAVNCFTGAWTWIGGLVLLGALLGFGIHLLRRYSLRRAIVPSGDAALLSLGLWVAACGPAGSFTPRIVFGPGGALVGRYATMSLLFAGVLLALAARQAARHGARGAAVAALWLSAVGMLVLFNLPAYDRVVAPLRRVIASDAALLVNNVALVGPAPLVFSGTIESVRAAAVFLHASRLNMFAPENGPPDALLAQARTVRSETLPVCRGRLDYGYALDGTGFLLRGWAADPSGKHNAAWIAAIEGTHGLIGMARPLAYRAADQTKLGAAAEPHDFESGFRFPERAATVDEGREVKVVALFPARPDLACRLKKPARIGPLRIVPATALRQIVALAPTAAVVSGGFAPIAGVAGTKDPGAPGGSAWRYGGSGTGTLHLAFMPGTGLGQDVAVPFATTDEGPGRRMVLHLGDGTQAWIELPSLWGRAAWRAVEIPRDMIARHNGLAAVEVQAAGAGWLSVGAPAAGVVEEDWARLF